MRFQAMSGFMMSEETAGLPSLRWARGPQPIFGQGPAMHQQRKARLRLRQPPARFARPACLVSACSSAGTHRLPKEGRPARLAFCGIGSQLRPKQAARCCCHSSNSRSEACRAAVSLPSVCVGTAKDNKDACMGEAHELANTPKQS